MSVDATRWAWSLSGLRIAEKLVLLALADRADEHNRCYPSYQRICADTCADRKTVSKAINSLIEKDFIVKTGECVGRTNSTPVYELVGVICRHETSTKNGTGTKTGTSTKNGMGSGPKNGTTKRSQKRDTESINIEPINEPITQNNKKGNENKQTNLEFNEPEKKNLNPNPGTHEEQIELDSDKPKKPKRNTKLEKEKFAQSVKEQWHKSVVQHGVKQTSNGSGVTDTDINNIARIIKYTKDEGSAMDYTNPDTWLNYFNELFRICKRKVYLQKCVKSFSWAVKPTTYQKLGDDTYLNLEEVA